METIVSDLWTETSALKRSPTNARSLRNDIDRRLAALFPRSDAEVALDQAVRYAVLAPGKRIRPVLTVLTARELGSGSLSALDAGCALEMVHAASLVLDDLPCMDDAGLRRGLPATHVAFGEDVAVLASITLLSRAFATVAAAPDPSAEQRASLVAILAKAVGSEGLSGGQFRDLRGADATRVIGGVDEANHRKTGALFVAAVEMGGVVAGASDAQMEELRDFAAELGQAFQILDDLDDGQGGESGLGEDGAKVTVLSFLGRDGARSRLDRHVAQACKVLRPGGELASFVQAIFGDVPARQGSYAAARQARA